MTVDPCRHSVDTFMVGEAPLTPTLNDIMDRIHRYSPDADLQPVLSAFALAARAHRGQTRKSGEPYLTHPLAVAMILADLGMDVDTIATALLHDALEDNPITKEEMEEEIGETVTELVDGVTKIGKLRFRSREELAAENFRKMMLAMSRDLRVILVKLADRLHNMSTLMHHNPEKQKQIAQETMEIYVPIANRLGLSSLKTELEDLCFRYLDPDAHKVIVDYLREWQVEREQYINQVISTIRGTLEGHGVECEVTGRLKSPHSIYRKMVRTGCKVEEINDLLAFRVMVADVGTCYAALGLLHAHLPPVPNRIKDYIARPKTNGYQSLHTTVIGPEDRRVEVQIRTEEMDKVAEQGVAAHWRYKEGHLALEPEDVARVGRIRELVETVQQGAEADAAEFMESVKIELYADEVFVFTPLGDVKQLPLGATALDFAYEVHSDLGNECTGARVNGRLVPLRHVLKSGDTVEIIRTQGQTPKRDWLDFVRTGKAIQKIRRYLRDVEREQGIRLGRDMLEVELRRHGWSMQRVQREGRLKGVLAARGHDSLDGLLIDVARGQETLRRVVEELLPDGEYKSASGQSQQNALTSLLNRFRKASTSPVLISGEDGLLVAFAKCCAPLPGEPVVGFITRGRGITVHREGCSDLENLDPGRRIPVEWDENSKVKHSGEIQVLCDDRPGMLAAISGVCERSGVNINSVDARTSDVPAAVTLQLTLTDVHELTKLIRSIEQVPGVEGVARTRG